MAAELTNYGIRLDDLRASKSRIFLSKRFFILYSTTRQKRYIHHSYQLYQHTDTHTIHTITHSDLTAMAAALKLRPKPNLLTTSLAFLLLCCCAYARLISDPADLISDGVSSAPLLRLYAADEACEQTYGFMPCTTSGIGSLFLILVYGYLMFLAATYLSAGSELLLELLGPGIVGGLFLPILGALPDALLILGNFNFYCRASILQSRFVKFGSVSVNFLLN